MRRRTAGSRRWRPSSPYAATSRSDEADAGADVGLLVLTGGVFRRPDAHALAAVVATLRADVELAGLLAKAQVAVDADFAVAPAGMLAAAGHDGAARTLLQDHLLG